MGVIFFGGLVGRMAANLLGGYFVGPRIIHYREKGMPAVMDVMFRSHLLHKRKEVVAPEIVVGHFLSLLVQDQIFMVRVISRFDHVHDFWMDGDQPIGSGFCLLPTLDPSVIFKMDVVRRQIQQFANTESGINHDDQAVCVIFLPKGAQTRYFFRGEPGYGGGRDRRPCSRFGRIWSNLSG